MLRRAGFTLVEVAVVLLILSVAFAVILPSLPRLTGSEKTTALRLLALQIRAVHEDAAFKKKAWLSSTISARTATS
jgi:prepilin-type N-terminal cleavage/methylation domain-containing protein